MTQWPGLPCPAELFAQRSPRVYLTAMGLASSWAASQRRIDAKPIKQRCQGTAFGCGQLGDITMAQHFVRACEGARHVVLALIPCRFPGLQRCPLDRTHRGLAVSRRRVLCREPCPERGVVAFQVLR